MNENFVLTVKKVCEKRSKATETRSFFRKFDAEQDQLMSIQYRNGDAPTIEIVHDIKSIRR